MQSKEDFTVLRQAYLLKECLSGDHGDTPSPLWLSSEADNLHIFE